MKAIRRYLRISPKKVNLVADLVRGKSAQQAVNFLLFTPKRSAKPLMETIRSAMANAQQNFKQDKDDLYVKTIIVNEGATLKRHRPVSRGRSHPILKRTSHIKVELGVRAKAAKSEKSVKTKTPRKAETAKPINRI